jgi:hypothetical protein
VNGHKNTSAPTSKALPFNSQ